MFADIKKALDEKWCSNENNQIITFYTPKGTMYYKIFSSYKIATESYYTTTFFSSVTDYTSFLQELQKRSSYNYNVNLDYNMPILTLSTCGATSSHRLVIHAQLFSKRYYIIKNGCFCCEQFAKVYCWIKHR